MNEVQLITASARDSNRNSLVLLTVKPNDPFQQDSSLLARLLSVLEYEGWSGYLTLKSGKKIMKGEPRLEMAINYRN